MYYYVFENLKLVALSINFQNDTDSGQMYSVWMCNKSENLPISVERKPNFEKKKGKVLAISTQTQP